MTTRGVGWNWEVKGIPPHPDGHMKRFDFAIKQFVWSLFSFACKLPCLYLIGAGIAIKAKYDSTIVRQLADVVIGWSAASWAFHGLNNAYRGGAAVSVALGLYEPRDWPPLFGELSEAWSVRQMWR
jgi:hypothetical protein